jgi:hypothetical protein
MRAPRRALLDLEPHKYLRLPRPLRKVQKLKREVRSLDPHSREIFASWFLWYDATAWERRLRRDQSEAC